MKAPIALPPLVHPTDPSYAREVFDVRQAAAYLLVHPARVYADVAAGVLACRRDGKRRLRFSQADLDAWRQANRQEVTDPRVLRKAVRMTKPTPTRAALPRPSVLRFNH